MSERTYDGVICFGGEDWWYHNRGHYDMQMMREMSRRMPVIYINSLGMRVPRMSEGSMFVKRIIRKLRSLRRGMVVVRDRFAVFSPFAIPGPLGMAISRRLLPFQIRRAAKRMGIRRPLVWIACPPGAEVYEALGAVGLVYQRTDRFEAFPGTDTAQIRGYHEHLRDHADVTVYCASLLYDDEADSCANAVYIDHGVDFDRFASAGQDPSSHPADIPVPPGNRVGFVGGIDDHTFDPPFFVEVARSLPEVQFILVGACSLPEDWCPLPNVHLLGQRPYEEVPGYMASCDVLIMPWNRSEWIRACNPIKLKEYLAVGRPIVTTDFYELRNYDGFVRIETEVDGFATAIRESLEQGVDASALRDRVRDRTWEAQANRMLEELERVGVSLSTKADASMVGA